MRNRQIDRIIFFSLPFLLTILTLACASIFALNQEAGEGYYHKGLQQLTSGDEAAAISSFKRATLKYRRLAKAFFELSKISLTKDSIEGRTTADYYLREAVSFDPKMLNIDWRWHGSI